MRNNRIKSLSVRDMWTANLCDSQRWFQFSLLVSVREMGLWSDSVGN